MAIYEDLGFCPANSFLHFGMEHPEKVSENWKRCREILGDRVGYMVYTPAGVNYKGWPYVVEALEASKTTLNVEVACKLQTLIPVCKYAETGKKILLTDVLNPYAIPGVRQIYSVNSNNFVAEKGCTIFQDGVFVVGVVDEKEAVHLYFYKK